MAAVLSRGPPPPPLTALTFRRRVVGGTGQGRRRALDFPPGGLIPFAAAIKLFNLAQMTPPTTGVRVVFKVQKDLELIRSSVSEIQHALANDPGNVLLQDLLVTTYQNELNTLANVQAAAGSGHTEVSL